MFVNVRILRNANDSDNGERSRTVAKSAALLHVSLHGQRAYRPADVTCGGRRRSAQSQRVSPTPASSNRSAILPWRAFQAVEVKPHRSLAAAGDATGVGTAGAPSPTRQQFRDSCELAVRLAARVCEHDDYACGRSCLTFRPAG